MTRLVVIAVCVAWQLTAVIGVAFTQSNRTAGPCSPIIENNQGRIVYNQYGTCNVYNPASWAPVQAIPLAPGLAREPAPPSAPSGPQFSNRFDLPAVLLSYDDLQRTLRRIQQALLRVSGLSSVLNAREELTIGRHDGGQGRLALFTLTGTELERVLAQPSTGFHYSFQSQVGAIRKVVIDYSPTLLGLGSLFIVSQNSASLDSVHDMISSDFDAYSSTLTRFSGFGGGRVLMISASAAALLHGTALIFFYSIGSILFSDKARRYTALWFYAAVLGTLTATTGYFLLHGFFFLKLVAVTGEGYIVFPHRANLQYIRFVQAWNIMLTAANFAVFLVCGKSFLFPNWSRRR